MNMVGEVKPICVAEVLSKRTELYTQNTYYSFAVIAESPRNSSLPSGLYAVRLLEFRTSKTGFEYPYCTLIKRLPEDLLEFVLALSETSSSTTKAVLDILERHKLFDKKELRRAKNLLNILFLHDSKELLYPELELKEDSALKELGIDIKKVRRIKNAILRAKQER